MRNGTVWRAQKGMRVRYAKDRISGYGVVLRVIGKDAYKIRDVKTDAVLQVSQQQISSV